jgi:hypothetical protein
MHEGIIRQAGKSWHDQSMTKASNGPDQATSLATAHETSQGASTKTTILCACEHGQVMPCRASCFALHPTCTRVSCNKLDTPCATCTCAHKHDVKMLTVPCLVQRASSNVQEAKTIKQNKRSPGLAHMQAPLTVHAMHRERANVLLAGAVSTDIHCFQCRGCRCAIKHTIAAENHSVSNPGAKEAKTRKQSQTDTHLFKTYYS